MVKTGYIETDDDVERRGSLSHLLQEEREVILILNDKDKTWEVSCSIPSYMRKFEAQGWECARTEYYRDGTVCTKFYKAPRSAVTIRKADRPKKVLSEEHKQKLIAARNKNSENN